MENLITGDIWAFVMSICTAIVLLSNAAEKIAHAWRAAKAPNHKQDERLTDLEEWRKDADSRLHNDHKRLKSIEEGNRASQRALLALLDHGLDGNNVEQMQSAKNALQDHLINRE